MRDFNVYSFKLIKIYFRIGEIRGRFNIFQLCIMDFFVSIPGIEFDEKELSIFVLGIDFGDLTIGGFGTFLAGFEVGFASLGFDINVVIQSDVFFSVDTLMNMLVVFEADGVDLTTDAFKADLALATGGAFFASTSATFTFDVFGSIFASVGVSLESLTASFKAELGPLCFGPGAFVLQSGGCGCKIAGMTYDSLASTCLCAAGFKFGIAEDKCICEDDFQIFSEKLEVCVNKPLDEAVATLDVFQMCVGNFIAESVADLDADAVFGIYRALGSINFGSFELGGLGAIFEANTEAFGVFFDVTALIESDIFFSINALVDIIAQFEIDGVDISDPLFVGDLDALITVDFWTATVETFTFDIFADFSANIGIELDITAFSDSFEAFGFDLSCFGPGSDKADDDTCTCSIDFMENIDGECRCLAANNLVYNFETGACGCRDEFEVDRNLNLEYLN